MAKQNTELEKVPTTEITTRHITSAADTKFIADDLSKFIREQKLFHNIQGKEYVNVEGWQYAGSRLGILPHIQELVRIPSMDETEIKYQAKVVLIDLRTGQTVGTGFAVCSNKEPSKKFYQEYAIASMAQTRGIGKAYRNILAWIIRAAGYEPTPAEEMDYITSTPVETEKRPVMPVAEKLNNNKTRAELAETEYVEPVTTAEIQPATINQKTQILLLLNVSCIKKDEKEKMVAKLHTFDKVRADAAIAKLKKTIHERGLETGEVVTGKQIELIEKLLQSHVFVEDERNQIQEQINTGRWLKTEAGACIEWLQEEIKVRKENEKITA